MATQEEIDAARRSLSIARREFARRELARETAEQTPAPVAMGGPSPEDIPLQDIADLQKAEEVLPFAALTVGAGALGWAIARRTLLAARPKLTRKWFGVFGPVMWRCGRCGTEVALGEQRCGSCGQHQNWPKWSADNI